MPLHGKYEPSTTQWVRDQVDIYESSGGLEGTDMRGMPVVILTMRGRSSGKLRKVPLMRVEHGGVYAAVASIGGAPQNPTWYENLLADPHIELQDGPVKQDMVVREITGDEKAQWWERCVAAFPNYTEYQAKTDRVIPVFLAEPMPA
ncbi:MAG: nitroreductase family deazaflavin-dependent oxidoreductase [Ilumatobacteraceae bacterium]